MSDTEQKNETNATNATNTTNIVNEVAVTIAVKSSDGTIKETQCRFHTPTLLATVEAMQVEDDATVSIIVPSINDAPARELVGGTQQEVVAALTKSVIPADAVGTELRKYTQFIVDHSNIKAIGIHCITTEGDNTNGLGFVITSPKCTMGEAVSFVNCGDANMDEFVTKAKIDIPTRNQTKGGVVIPTQEDIDKLK